MPVVVDVSGVALLPVASGVREADVGVVPGSRGDGWLEGKDCSVENHGVDPDIEVEHTPADLFGEHDPQLDRATAEAFRMLEEKPAVWAPKLPQPRMRR